MIDRPADGAATPAGRTGGAAAPGRAVAPGDRLADALQQLQDAAAPFLALLHPAIRDSLQAIGRTAEE